MKNLTGRRLLTLLIEGCERITTPLGKIEFKMLYFLKCSNFIFHYLNR